MIRLVQRRLIIPRGDTGSFSIPALSTVAADDVAVFSIWTDATKEKIFQKKIDSEDGTLTVAFTHNDTVNLPVGKYVWDIKYYRDPVFVDDELVGGEVVDSYYAAFTLPVCEIRETADNLLTSNEAPSATLSPEQLDIISAALAEMTKAVDKTNDNVTHYPKIIDNVWYIWSSVGNEYITTDVPANGNPGPRGNGISNIELNANYTITFTTDDGEQYTLGSIRGPIGPIPQFSVGIVQEGATAAATITGTAENPVLNLTLPNANVPTKVSQLENDSGYLTAETDPTVPAWAKAATKPSYTATEVGALPANTFIPAVTSDLTNDSNFAVDANYVHTDNNYTTAEKEKLAAIEAGAQVNVKADWNATTGDAQILNKPTKVSDFENDAGYLNVHQDISGKQDVLTFDTAPTDTSTNPVTSTGIKQYVDTAITNINTMRIHICSAEEYNDETGLPEINNPDAQTFYLTPGGDAPNLYIEWAYVNNKWERFGSADVDLSNYVTFDDHATATKTGAVKVGASGYGIKIVGAAEANGGTIYIEKATDAQIKQGTNNYVGIVPINQHTATFYGLAKAAGDSTQASSTNAVGTYTDAAKTAIQTMLDVPATSVIPTKVSDLTNDANYYTVPATGIPASTLAAGVVPVQDVQVNSASILSNGVANVDLSAYIKNTDYATATTAGVVKVGNSGTGIKIVKNAENNVGALYVEKATNEQVQQSEHVYNCIVPANQHAAAFYGLAKAAGDTTQIASSNEVGTYTEAAKTAIKNMLGITQTITVTAVTQDDVTVTGQTVYVRADDANGEVFAQAAYEGQSVSFAVPRGFTYFVEISDTLAHHFNPTTATGIISDADISITLQYSDFTNIKTASDVKAALNAGLDLTDLVGESITCTRDGSTLTWDITDYDAEAGTVMLWLHDAFGTSNMVFEPAQALMWCENGLAAGNYTFHQNATIQLYFTLTTAIPEGGQLRATTTAFQTYTSQSATAMLESGTVSTDEIAGAIDLGTVGQGLLNDFNRVSNGSNNYAESALFWWLNSDAPANTPRVPVIKFSRAYAYTVPGFLYNLDEDFLNCIEEIDWPCSTNNIYECPESLGGLTRGTKQTYSVRAKFGLASEMEIYGSYGGTADGSVAWDLFKNATADDRKRYRDTAVQNVWLRSPHGSFSVYVRSVSSSGSASNGVASLSNAVVPACRIKRDS